LLGLPLLAVETAGFGAFMLPSSGLFDRLSRLALLSPA